MSKTNKHTSQRKLKDIMKSDKPNDVVDDAWVRFWRGPIRHGNKRHYEAYMKWKSHKADRYKRNHVDPSELVAD